MPIVIRPPNTKWFLSKMADLDLDFRGFAAKVGIEYTALYRMIHGERKFHAADAAKIAKIFGVSTEEVVKNFGDLRRGEPESERRAAARALPVVGMVDDKGGVARKGVTGVRKVARPANVKPDTVALRYAGEGLMSGWLFYYLPTQGIDPKALGKLCVIEAASETFLGQLVGENKIAGHYCTTRLNSARLESAAVKSAAPVLWISP